MIPTMKTPLWRTKTAFLKSGRGDWIRTSDNQFPELVRYRAALRPDTVIKAQ